MLVCTLRLILRVRSTACDQAIKPSLLNGDFMLMFITAFVVSYIWHGLGITVGYHRLLSHRSFACSKAVEYFWVIPAYLAFEGSPIWWTTIHRAHHRHVDTPLDPHSPRYGLYHAHTGWILERRYPAHIDPKGQSKDLMKDPIYRFICFGWVAASASLLAGVAVQQIPTMLNVVCHIPKLGYKNFAGDDDSVNVWWVALLAMGEGWHNNHHAFQGSARSGMKPWEIDVSWWTIALMRRFGLVWRVNDHHSLLIDDQVRPVPVKSSLSKIKASPGL
jgi:stearoyl-CoA desaturase (delta-9 desaturase)